MATAHDAGLVPFRVAFAVCVARTRRDVGAAFGVGAGVAVRMVHIVTVVLSAVAMA
jgi:hypothetical protein